MAEYLIDDTELTGIANALRNLWRTNGTFTPAQMAAKINATPIAVPLGCELRVMDHVNPLTDEWERPSEWPDIEALADEIEGDLDCLYLTYDLTCHPDYHWLGFQVATGNANHTWKCDRLKYINNEWTVVTSFTTASGTTLRYDLTQEEDNDTILLWRITSANHILTCGFMANTDTQSNNFRNVLLPCVERAGTLPWCYNWGDSPSNYPAYRAGATMWMEHDSAVFGKLANVTNLNLRWSQGFNLYSIDVSKWDTSNWHVTNFGSTFSGCLSLKRLDLSNWNTKNWAVTSMSYLFFNCMNLEELDVSTWDTSNWAVTTLLLTWGNNYNLKKLDLSSWDTSNWAVTDFRGVWTHCKSLIELDIESWKTDNWAVTKMNTAWAYCTSLRELHLNNWDTSNWSNTELNGVWEWCLNLRILEIDLWDTSNWVIPSLSSTWGYCVSLRELHLNDWNTSNWTVNTLSNTWQNCFSLKVLEIGDWNTSNWAVTTLYYTWTYCESLRELDISDWDTSNWAVTSLAYTWGANLSLSELDISSWDTSKWAVTNTSGIFMLDYNLKTLLTPASIGIVNGLTSNVLNTPLSYKLQTFSGYTMYGNQNYADYCFNFTTQSLKNILNRLPTVSSTKTVNMGLHNLAKLTAEDIAVATNKGWTLA